MQLSRLVFVLAVALALPRAARADDTPDTPDHLIHYRDQVMGTVIDITMWTDKDDAAAKAAHDVFAEFKRVDELMSSWREGSDVARINEAAGAKPVQVDPEVMLVTLRALKEARATKGAFDITVGAFRGLWKFDQDIDGSIPERADVLERVKLVGYRNVQTNAKKRTVRLKKKGMRITLGGVAKGYAVDQAVHLMHERGFVDFIIQAGGDLYAAGRRGNRAWRVGIRDPRGARDSTFALTEIENGTFSTSGDYERGMVKDGVRYHHILDPKTGYPANKSRSVTVLAPDALTADIWSTSLFVLGPVAGMALVEKHKELEAVFVSAKNEVTVSSGLKDKLIILRPPTDAI